MIERGFCNTFTFVNHMLYADDICIISLSPSGLQRLLNICDDYCKLHDLIFNCKELNVYIFQHHYEQTLWPSRNLSGNSVCQFVQEVKYLGVIIHSTMKTTKDVARQTRKFYLQANLLLRNFRHCSDDVKCALFTLTVLICIVVSCGLIRRKVA